MCTEPNFFDFARMNEAGQDAFLAWLLSYADNNYKGLALHNIANSLICKFTDKQIEIDTIKVEHQKGNIDILVTINDNIHIIIEDKISCSEHNNQLDRYKKLCQELYPGENYFIYFKTGAIAPTERTLLEEKKWKLFGREDFIKILKSEEKIDNVIYRDYYARILDLDSKYKFKETPFIKWDHFNWIGFFIRLNKEVFPDGGWGYVPNPSGGFMGFWWNQIEVYNKNNTTAYLYMLLGGNQLSYNVNVDNKTQQSLIRNTCYEIMNELFEASRPKKFGKGKNMAFAHHKDDIWVCDENGFLKFEEVCENLKQATSALSEKKDEFIKCLEKHLCNETEQ